jgi:hypothetical protein
METSIQWLRDKLAEEFRFYFSDNIFEAAKDLHKQQTIKFAEDYTNNCVTGGYDGEVVKLKSAEEYYNKTFKK